MLIYEVKKCTSQLPTVPHSFLCRILANYNRSPSTACSPLYFFLQAFLLLCVNIFYNLLPGVLFLAAWPKKEAPSLLWNFTGFISFISFRMCLRRSRIWPRFSPIFKWYSNIYLYLGILCGVVTFGLFSFEKIQIKFTEPGAPL